MKFKRVTAFICALACITATTVSAVVTGFFNAENFKSQADFILNREDSEFTFDMNCDNKINVIDYIMMKRIELSEEC